jgi:hypothetical protein
MIDPEAYEENALVKAAVVAAASAPLGFAPSAITLTVAVEQEVFAGRKKSKHRREGTIVLTFTEHRQERDMGLDETVFVVLLAGLRNGKNKPSCRFPLFSLKPPAAQPTTSSGAPTL